MNLPERHLGKGKQKEGFRTPRQTSFDILRLQGMPQKPSSHPESSEHLTLMNLGRKSSDVCSICGKAISSDGLKKHEKEAHSTILRIRESCLENAKRIFTRCVIAGALVFLILSVCIVILIPVEQQYWILLGFFPIVMSGMVGGWYWQREMKPFEESLESVAYECYCCGTPVHRDSFSEHFRIEHRQIHRWMKVSFYLLLGLPAAVALLSAHAFWTYLSWPVYDALEWRLAPGLATAVIWAIVVEYLVMPRIEARGNG